MYQKDLQWIERYRPLDPFEVAIDEDRHNLIKETISEYHGFDIQIAKDINIMVPIRRNQPILHASDFRIGDLTTPERCNVGSEISIETSVSLTTGSTDAHRDDDFEWYAILLLDGDFIQTYPDKPFKDAASFDLVDMPHPIRFIHTPCETGMHTIEVIVVLEGTQSIQSQKKSSTIEVVVPNSD